MKITAVICCLFLCSFAMAQDKRKDEFKRLVLGKYNYVYDNQNCQYFFAQAKSLIELNNPDSSNKASKIMWGLYLFDTAKFSFEGFVPLLDKIVQSNTRYYENNLTGVWRFSHDFLDGMGSALTTTTDKDTCRVIQFDGHNVAFYFNDSLYRKTSYNIEPYQSGFEFQRVNIYNICFYDSDDKWQITLTPKNMEVRTYPICVCGCYINIYKKIEDGAPIVGK